MFTLGMLIPILVSVLVLLFILWIAKMVMGWLEVKAPADKIVLAIIGLVWLIGLLHYLGVT